MLPSVPVIPVPRRPRQKEDHKCLQTLLHSKTCFKTTTTTPQMSNSTEAGIRQLGHLRGLLSNVTSLQAFIVSCPNASSLILQAYTSLEAFCRFVKESSILIILSMNFFGCRSLFSMKDECLRSIFRATLSGWQV